MGSKFLTICNQSADVVCLWHWDMQVESQLSLLQPALLGLRGS